MIRVETAEGERYVGFSADVVYRVELEMALVDDGDRLFKIQAALIDTLTRGAETTADGALREVLDAHPTIFRLFTTREAALGSVNEREI